MTRPVGPPRKVIVGTAMYPMWGEYPGVEARLEQLGGLVDQMAAKAAERYDGANLDLAVLPEYAVTGGRKGPAAETAVPLDGLVLDRMGAKAAEHGCYVVVPLVLRETEMTGGPVGEPVNAAVILDRSGKLVGVYRKVHAVSVGDPDQLEGGVAPGRGFPVFDLDFGRVGIQICFDMAFDDGWDTLARKGAELVLWPSQSPGRISAATRAMRGKYYVLSSTWRHNASLLDPTGHRIREIRQDRNEGPVFVEQIDLAYVLLGWQPSLANGKAFDDAFGEKAGYRYSEAEDGGIFWSNDPKMPISEMVRQLKLNLPGPEIQRNRILQDKLRGGPPSLE